MKRISINVLGKMIQSKQKQINQSNAAEILRHLAKFQINKQMGDDATKLLSSLSSFLLSPAQKIVQFKVLFFFFFFLFFYFILFHFIYFYLFLFILLFILFIYFIVLLFIFIFLFLFYFCYFILIIYFILFIYFNLFNCFIILFNSIYFFI